MNFFPYLPWGRSRPAPIPDSFVVVEAEEGNNSNSRSPSKPSSEDLSSADTFPENNSFAALPAVSRLSYVPLASTLVTRLQYNRFPVAALAKIYQIQSFPVPFHYESIEGCAAGVLVLATRANLAPDELTAEAILAFLWILQSFHSQYGSEISTVSCRFTELLDLSAPEKAALQRSMIALQSQFLARLDWKIRLDNTEELKYAYKTLLLTPGFIIACSNIESKAVRFAKLESKQQEQDVLLPRAGANSTSEEVTPSIMAPDLLVPIQFSAARILGPASFPIISSRVFPSASFVTPAVSYRSYPSSLSEEDYNFSDDEDVYSDLEEYEDVEDEEEEEKYYLLAAGTADADAAPAARAPLLGKRQLKPSWENETTDEPPRKKLIFTTKGDTRSYNSSTFFKTMLRPFPRAFSRRN